MFGAACGDDDDDDSEQIEENLSEGVEDVSSEVEQQVDEGEERVGDDSDPELTAGAATPGRLAPQDSADDVPREQLPWIGRDRGV